MLANKGQIQCYSLANNHLKSLRTHLGALKKKGNHAFLSKTYKHKSKIEFKVGKRLSMRARARTNAPASQPTKDKTKNGKSFFFFPFNFIVSLDFPASVHLVDLQFTWCIAIRSATFL